MVLSGTECPVQAGVEEVAEATIRCFRRPLPASVPGIAFLSGGQSPELSTAHLNAMNLIGPQPAELQLLVRADLRLRRPAFHGRPKRDAHERQHRRKRCATPQAP